MFGNTSHNPGKSLIAIISSDQANSEIEFISGKLPEIKTSIKQTDDTIKHANQLVNGSADVVIIEADLSNQDSEHVLRKLCDYVSQSGSLIVLARNVTPANTRMLFKCGVNDVLSLPINRNELLQSLESAFGEQAKKDNRPHRGKVITLLKSGGGVGSTTLATNLGYQLLGKETEKTSTFGRKKKVPPQKQVVILDFDVQFGTVGLSLNIDSRMDILDIRKAEDRFDASLLSSTFQTHKSGLNLLTAPEEIVPFEAFEPEFFDKLLNITQAMFDYVIIDMPQAWTNWTQIVLAKSDLVIPVTTPSVENISNLQKMLSAMDHMKISSGKQLVIINKISKGIASKNRIAQIQKLIERPTGLMREDTKIHIEARDRGELLHSISGSAGTIKNISQCSEKLITHFKSQRTTKRPLSNDEAQAPSIMT